MDGIIDNSTVKKFPRIFLYGVPGIGKTSFGAQFPNPIFICTEDGAGNLPIKRFPIVTNYEQFNLYLERIRTEKHDFKTLVIDSMDWLQSLIFDWVAEFRFQKASFDEIGFGKGPGAAAEEMGKVLQVLDDIMYQRGMTIVLLGHSLVKGFNNPNGDNYDQYRPDLHDKVRAPIMEWADLVAFVNYEVYTKKDANGIIKAQGGGNRILYTEERPAFLAKNRYQMPESLDFPLDKAAAIVWKAILEGQKKIASKGQVKPPAPPVESQTQPTVVN